jgi:hypothetical protein
MTRAGFLVFAAAFVVVLSLTHAASGQKAESDKAEVEKLLARLKELELRNKALRREVEEQQLKAETAVDAQRRAVEQAKTELDKASKEATLQRALAEQLKQLAEEAFRKLKFAEAKAEEAVKARRAADAARQEAERARLEAEKQRQLAEDLDRKTASEQRKALAALLEINVAYFERVLEQQPKNADAKGILAQTQLEIAKLQYQVGDLDQARARCAKAVALYRDLAKTEPASARHNQGLASSLHQMGLTNMKLDRADLAVRDFRQSIEVGEKLLRDAPHDKGRRTDLARTYRTLIDLLHSIGERQDINELNERVKQIAEK